MNTSVVFLLCSLWLMPSARLMPPAPGVEFDARVWQRYSEMELNSYQSVSLPSIIEARFFAAGDTFYFPVVIMEYSDVSARYDDDDFNQMLFGDWSTGSAADYYAEVSYGQISVSGQAYGPYTANNSASYYADDNYGIGDNYPHCAGSLVIEACQASDPFVDYSIYDNDDDGYVDIFTVIHVGKGAEETDNTGDIWSHEFSLEGWAGYGGPGPYQTDDGVIIDVYTMNPELSDYSVQGSNGISNIGVFCHEWGHGFGLPDLYITDGSYAGGAGLGDFCLMASGSWAGDPPGSSPVHLSAWCKYFMGWLEPDSCERDLTDSIPDAEFPTSSLTPHAWRILDNPSGVDWSFSSVGSGEFFLAENRQQVGFDEGLPGEGLLILHVDESQETNSNLSNPLVGIMQADGDGDYLYTSSAGSGSDLWSNDVYGFTNSSVPSSRFYDGQPSEVKITDISYSDSLMTADLEIGVVLLGSISSYPNPFNVHEHQQATIAYQPSDAEKAEGDYPDFRVNIYNLAGELVRVLDQKPREISVYGRVAYWDGLNDNWFPVASGLYFYVIEIYEGEQVIDRNKGKLTLVR